MSESHVSATESSDEGENASAHSRPRPRKPPVYQRASDKLSFAQDRDWGFDDVVDALFFIFSGVATLWLAYVFFGRFNQTQTYRYRLVPDLLGSYRLPRTSQNPSVAHVAVCSRLFHWSN